MTNPAVMESSVAPYRAWLSGALVVVLSVLLSLTGQVQPAWAAHFKAAEVKVDIVEYNATTDQPQAGTGVFFAKVTVNSAWTSGGSTKPNKLTIPGGSTSTITCDGTTSSSQTQTDIYYCPLPTSGASGMHILGWDSNARISSNFNVGATRFSYEAGFTFDPANPDPAVSGWFGSPRMTASLQTRIGGGQSFSQNLGGQTPNTTKATSLSFSFMEDSTNGISTNGTPVSAENDDGGTGGNGRPWDGGALAGLDLATLSADGDLAISSTVTSHIAAQSVNKNLALKIRMEESVGGSVVGFVTRDIGIAFFVTSNNAPVVSGFEQNQIFRVVAGTTSATTFTITGTDNDGDGLTISLANSFPAWASQGSTSSSTSEGVTTATKAITLQPPSGTSLGTISVEVTVTDNKANEELTASRTFRIVVVDAPVVDVVGNGQVQISWINPTPTAPDTLDGTKVQFSSDSGSTWSTFETASASSTSSTVTGLSNGTSYVFRTLPQINSGGAVSDGTESSQSESATPRGTQVIAWNLSTAEKTLLLSETGLTVGSDVRSATAQTTISYSVVSAGTPSCSLDGSNVLTFTALGTCTLRAAAAEAGAFQAATLDVEFTIANSRPTQQSGGGGGGGGGTQSSPPPSPSPVVTAPALPRVVPTPTPVPLVQQGPVLRGNVAPAPPSVPTATIGGRSTPIQTQVTSPTGFSLTAGVLNLGLQVQQDQGVVRQNGTGGTEVEVRKGSTAALTGSGLLPRSTVQVFLPLQGTNAKEVARIPVDETGAFSGDAVFATRANERPMPIGRQVMQIVSLDEDGQQSVLEMTINIAQGAPAPEFDRAVGQVPTLTPGQSVATNAGEPEVVRVTADSAVKSATVEGDGWRMSVNIEGARGEVSESGEGGALLQFVRDEGIIVTGGGFMPGTRADVWLFSEPTLLGTVDIDENGEFSGTVMVDGNVVPVGDHTLQLQGVGEDGFVRAANLGVTVSDAVAEVTTEEAAGGLLWWLWVLLILLALLMWFALWRYRRTREASGR